MTRRSSSPHKLVALLQALFFATIVASTAIGLFWAHSYDERYVPVTAVHHELRVRSPYGAVITQQTIDLAAEQVAFMGSQGEYFLAGQVMAHFKKRTECTAVYRLTDKRPSDRRGEWDWMGVAKQDKTWAVVWAKNCA